MQKISPLIKDTNLKQLILCSIWELLMESVLQHLGDESHPVSDKTARDRNVRRMGILTRLTRSCKNVRPLARNVRNFIHRDDDGRQEFVSDRLHVLDGGLESRPHLLVGHGLLWSHIVGQLTVEDRGQKGAVITSYRQAKIRDLK